jgi:polar amino acid transport system substrate-binding protein
MKRLLTTFLLFASLGSVACVPVVSAGGTVARITNGDWPPFLGERLPGNGAISEVVREAFALKGIETKYGFFPWARALAIAAEGKWDASVGWAFSEERARDFFFSDALVDLPVILFSLTSKKVDWKEWKDLAGLSIGVTRGYHYGSEFEKAREEGLFRTDVSPDDETCIRKLLGKRVDAVPVDKYVGIELINRRFAGDAKRVWYSEKPVRAAPYYLLFSKKAPNAEKLLADSPS